MRPYRLQEDGLLTLMLHECEDDAQVVSGATGPRALEITLELVRLQTGVERILCQLLQRRPQALGGTRMVLCQPPRGPYESTGPDEEPPHERISSISLSVVDGRQSPSANSRWASWTSAMSRFRPRSVMRRFTIATRVSCSSQESRSTASSTSANGSECSTIGLLEVVSYPPISLTDRLDETSHGMTTSPRSLSGNPYPGPSMSDQSVQVESIRAKCSFEPIPGPDSLRRSRIMDDRHKK